MATASYSTAEHPYPAAMWDEAAETLALGQGWTTVLLVCPNPAETEATAIAEMSARGISDLTALVFDEEFSGSHIIRISTLTHIEPEWDHLAAHFAEGKPAAILALEGDSNTLIDKARAAMAERGFNVGVGITFDPISGTHVLRIESA